MEFPENFFHLRKPLMDPMPGTLPESEIHARLVEALDVFEPDELDELKSAAKGGLDQFSRACQPAMGLTYPNHSGDEEQTGVYINELTDSR